MQSFTGIGHGLYRIVFRGGSPQRVHYAPRLTVFALLALVALARASRLYVFGGGFVSVILYLFTWLSGLYLAVALASRRVPRNRLRTAVQAALLIAACAHLVLLLAAPLAESLSVLRYVLAGLAAGAVLMGFTSCTQYALGGPRARAVGYTLIFAFALTAFYATMHTLLDVALV